MDEKIEKMTEEILIKNDIYKIPADIIAIAKNNNINVYKMDMPNDNIMGIIRYDSKSDSFIIALNKKLSLNQQRFTLAHELGHFFLNRKELQSEELHIDIMYRITDEEEKEVEYFAGALLMNKTLLEKTYEKIKDIKDLAKLFEVSESDMTYRLKILEML